VVLTGLCFLNEPEISRCVCLRACLLVGEILPLALSLQEVVFQSRGNSTALLVGESLGNIIGAQV
jgi:hypothetical protein